MIKKRHLTLCATLAILVAIIFAEVQAAPFLACDPYPPTGPQPTTFLLTLDLKPEVSVAATDAPPIPPATASPGKWLKWDIATVPFGRHTVTIKAKNASATSASSAPFSFDVGIGTPLGIIVIP